MSNAKKYIIFAFVSTAANMILQFISLYFYSGFLDLYLAIIIGTIVGLIIKYILDKKYIFYYVSINRMDSNKKFILYSSTGVFTTLIFWGFEIAFDYVFNSVNAKYVGGVIGLSIGYTIKYFLDRIIVFKA